MVETPLSGSYVTVEAADTYLADDPRAVAWLALDDDQKAWYLKRATKALDAIQWQGYKYLENQALQFPRKYPIDPNSQSPWGSTISIDSYGYAYQSAVPAEVITACMEEALALYSFYSSPQNTKRQFLQQQGVKSFSLDDLSESYGAVSYTYGLKSPEALELIDKYIEHSPFLV